MADMTGSRAVGYVQAAVGVRALAVASLTHESNLAGPREK